MHSGGEGGRREKRNKDIEERKERVGGKKGKMRWSVSGGRRWREA